MSARLWLGMLAVLTTLGWWYSDLSPRVPEAPRLQDGRAAIGCPRPPMVAAGQEPLQTSVPAGMGPFRLKAASLSPLAGISIDARVLSRRNYLHGATSEISPTDLALGWQQMTEDDVLERLSISQSGRWYQYRWSDEPPLSPATIVRQSANMHMIPSSRVVAEALAQVRPDQRVRIDGWLVEAKLRDGIWRSSTTREDTGDGACELIYVCAMSVIP